MPDADTAFRRELAATKQRHPEIPWYPYDTLANLSHLARLLETGDVVGRLGELAGAGPCADIGTGDGDLCFLLERRLGLEVDAIDCAATNNNGCAGFRFLHSHLQSRATLIETDLDHDGALPANSYPLVLFLGVFYHLKNPFRVLEEIARRARWVLLSTRVWSGQGDLPAAYLVDADELNDDNSNYWLMTERALERVIRRSGLAIRARHAPAAEGDDQRVFLLLESEHALRHLELITGWHEPDDRDGYRWTARQFAAGIPHPRPGAPARLKLRLFVPELWFSSAGSRVTLRLDLSGRGHEFSWTEAGEKNLTIDLPAAAAWSLTGEVERPPVAVADGRDLGLIVAGCSVAA